MQSESVNHSFNSSLGHYYHVEAPARPQLVAKPQHSDTHLQNPVPPPSDSSACSVKATFSRSSSMKSELGAMGPSATWDTNSSSYGSDPELQQIIGSPNPQILRPHRGHDICKLMQQGGQQPAAASGYAAVAALSTGRVRLKGEGSDSGSSDNAEVAAAFRDVNTIAAKPTSGQAGLSGDGGCSEGRSGVLNALPRSLGHQRFIIPVMNASGPPKRRYLLQRLASVQMIRNAVPSAVGTNASTSSSLARPDSNVTASNTGFTVTASHSDSNGTASNAPQQGTVGLRTFPLSMHHIRLRDMATLPVIWSENSESASAGGRRPASSGQSEAPKTSNQTTNNDDQQPAQQSKPDDETAGMQV